jgi:hypothetical protein
VGTVLQVQTVIKQGVDNTAVLIPTDQTVPQIGEGKQLFTLTITPFFANSKILIWANINYSLSTAVAGGFALFRDAVSSAIGADGNGRWCFV